LACAALLARAGYRVRVVVSEAGAYDAFEAFDASFEELLRAAGVDEPLRACDARLVRAFNGARYAVARRARVRDALYESARRAGAAFVARGEMPPSEGGWLVDATGRTALHTPVVRDRPAVAYLFEAPPAAKLAMRSDELGWGYRIGDERGSTVGVVLAEPRASAATARAWAQGVFGITLSAQARPLRRAAAPQRCRVAIDGRRIAVGDAAVVHDPAAGSGQRFALASALSAVAVIRTCAEKPSSSAAARAFYDDLVARAARRSPHDPHSTEPARADLERQYCFAGSVRRGGVLRDGFVAEDELVEWDGGSARWSCGVDLVRLAEASATPTSGRQLVDRLIRAGYDPDRAVAAVAWAVARGVLRRCGASATSAGVPGAVL
jgi:hypothetical protein